MVWIVAVVAAAAAGCGCFWPSHGRSLLLSIDGGGQLPAEAIHQRRHRKANGQTTQHFNLKENLYDK